jgi:hypothetical protein
MGTGKVLICKQCGTSWMHLIGVGMKSSLEELEQEMQHPGTVNNPDPMCPECGSNEYEDTGAICHWD